MRINKIKILLLLGLLVNLNGLYAQDQGNKEEKKDASESVEESQIESTEGKNLELFMKYKSERIKNYPATSKEVTKAKQEELGKVVSALEMVDPNSYEFHLSTYDNSNNSSEAYVHLQSAYALQPGNVESYDSFIAYSEITSDEELKKEFCIKLNNAGVYTAAEMAYNKNVLFSLEDNSYLITNGNADTYPAWIQQEVNGLRKNIQVLNLELLQNEGYRNKKFTEMQIPIGTSTMNSSQIVAHILSHKNNGQVYLALTLNKSILMNYSSSLWLTGMALQYDLSPNFDYMQSVSSNWENYFSKDYIETNDQINRNYLLILKKLSIYYKENNNKKQEKEVNKLMQTICDNFGMENPLE